MIVEEVKKVRVVGVCAPIVARMVKTDAINKNIEGQLIEVTGVVKSIAQGEFVLNDGRGDALVYIDLTTKIQLLRLVVGQSVRVVGVVSRAHGQTAILPRCSTDLTEVTLVIATSPTATSAPRMTSTRAPTTTASRIDSPAPPTRTSTGIPGTPSATPRAFMRPTPASAIDARALAAEGGSTSIAAGLVAFAIGAMLLRRHPR